MVCGDSFSLYSVLQVVCGGNQSCALRVACDIFLSLLSRVWMTNKLQVFCVLNSLFQIPSLYIREPKRLPFELVELQKRHLAHGFIVTSKEPHRVESIPAHIDRTHLKLGHRTLLATHHCLAGSRQYNIFQLGTSSAFLVALRRMCDAVTLHVLGKGERPFANTEHFRERHSHHQTKHPWSWYTFPGKASSAEERLLPLVVCMRLGTTPIFPHIKKILSDVVSHVVNNGMPTSQPSVAIQG